MIVCSGCGNAMEDDLRFCTECGMQNPTMRSGETTASLGETVRQQGVVPGQVNFQKAPTVSSQANSVRDATYNQRTLTLSPSMPHGDPALHRGGTKPNRTPLIIICAAVSGLLLLILGGVGSRLLLSDKPAEKASDTALSATPQNDMATTPQRTATLPQSQAQTQSEVQPRNTTAPTFDEATLRREVIDTLNGWAGATRAHDLDRHMSYYADRLDTYFTRSNVGINYVRSSRTPAFERYSSLDVQLSNISVTVDQSGTMATATFDKTYRFEGEKVLSGSVQDMVTLNKINGRWLITSERDLRVYYTNK